jgi:predicted kinase
MNFRTFLETSNEKVLIIMRALPGAGKSFEVNKILKEKGVSKKGHVFSTDEFFDKSPDGYKETFRKAIEGGYVSELLTKYHKMNEERAKKAMSEGVSPIIIDNVNADLQSMQPYIDAGTIYGYKIVFREPSSPHWQRISPLLKNKEANAEKLKMAALELAAKNQHDVPYESIVKMLDRWYTH